jgi:hypothetical protein
MIVSAGGFVGVGAAASTLLACNAAAAQQDLQSLANGPQGIVNQTLVNLCTAIGAAANGTLTGGAAFEALIAASSFVPNIANILPAIPDCSSIARLAP